MTNRDFAALERRVEERGYTMSIGGNASREFYRIYRGPSLAVNLIAEVYTLDMAFALMDGLDCLDLREKARELCRRYDEAVADFQGVVNCEAAIPVSVVRQAFGIEEDK